MTGSARVELAGAGRGASRARGRRLGPRLRRRAAVALGIAVTVVHLAAQLTGANALADGTQMALMPLLAVYLLAVTSAPRPRLVRLTLVGLAFSWLGDTAPQLVADDASFLVMIGFFLLAQVSYIVAFAPTARRGPLRRHPVLLTGYAAAFALLLVACVPGAGSLLVPAVCYGACLATMAALSSGVHPAAAVGGVVFFISDAMIALGEFAPWFVVPAADFWIMLTYVVGQTLLVVGVTRSCGSAPAAWPPTRRGADRPAAA